MYKRAHVFFLVQSWLILKSENNHNLKCFLKDTGDQIVDNREEKKKKHRKELKNKFG